MLAFPSLIPYEDRVGLEHEFAIKTEATVHQTLKILEHAKPGEKTAHELERAICRWVQDQLHWAHRIAMQWIREHRPSIEEADVDRTVQEIKEISELWRGWALDFYDFYQDRVWVSEHESRRVKRVIATTVAACIRFYIAEFLEWARTQRQAKASTVNTSRQDGFNGLVGNRERIIAYEQPHCSGERFVASGAAPAAGGGGTSTESQLEPARHSLDFRSVHWYGTDYTFTAMQAACVKVLWEAWEKGTPDVGGKTILDRAGSERDKDTGKPLDVFRGHAAWGTMIVRGETKGTHRLAEPRET